jgi:hypothetical protein
MKQVQQHRIKRLPHMSTRKIGCGDLFGSRLLQKFVIGDLQRILYATNVRDLQVIDIQTLSCHDLQQVKGKAVRLHAMEALGGRGDIAPTHSRPRH